MPSKRSSGTSRTIFGLVVLFVLAVSFLSSRSSRVVLRHEPDLLALQAFFPTDENGDALQNLNHQQLQALVACLATNTCSANQSSIVLLSGGHWVSAAIGGYGVITGEIVWSTSMYRTMLKMGYTVLVFRDMKSTLDQFLIHPELVKIVIFTGTEECFKSGNCFKAPWNPYGIPAWKIFNFEAFWDVKHPLGPRWQIAPEPYDTGVQYIGYSIEEKCNAMPKKPLEERSKQVFVLGKYLTFYYKWSFSWSETIFRRINNELGLRLVTGMFNDTDFESEWPAFIENPEGILTPQKFNEMVSDSVALMGLGEPAVSPSPYDALCLGVPFINPILRWDADDPTDRSSWETQHDLLKAMDPPYVYHIFKQDEEGLLDALRSAATTPLSSYVLPRMTQAALEKRLHYLIEHDWLSDAVVLFAERKAKGEDVMFSL